MRCRLKVSGLAIVAALCLLPTRAVAKKHKDSAGVHQCQQRVAERIQADHPPSQGSSFKSDVQRSALGSNAVTISGQGRVRTAQGKNRSFSYSCVYNHRNGKLSKVKYSIR